MFTGGGYPAGCQMVEKAPCMRSEMNRGTSLNADFDSVGKVEKKKGEDS